MSRLRRKWQGKREGLGTVKCSPRRGKRDLFDLLGHVATLTVMVLVKIFIVSGEGERRDVR
jgi:hypothetical protein